MLQSTSIADTARHGCFQVTNHLHLKLPIQDKYALSTIISSHVKRGQWQNALAFFEHMHQHDVTPDRVTFLSVLKACSVSGNLEWARLIHSQIVFLELDTELTISNSLINMYCKCGSLEDANTVFYKLDSGDCMSWGAIIAGHVHHGHVPLAVELFRKMLKGGISPSKMLMIHILTACRDVQDISSAKKMQDVIKMAGIEIDSVPGSILVDMYAKHGKFEDAFEVLDMLKAPNVVVWNAIISGQMQYGHGLQALYVYEKVLTKGLVPTHITFSSVLTACGMTKGFEETKLVHDKIVRSGIVIDVVLGNCLVGAYCKCGRLEEALFVFENAWTHDVASWGALISGHVEHGNSIVALQIFQSMQQQGLTPNAIIFSCVLQACGSVEDISRGRAIHGQINECELQSDRIIHSSLIDMYTKCRSLFEACKVFDELPDKDVVTWATMITGYTQHGQGHLGFKLFEKMHLEKVAPTKVIFLCVLKACMELDDSTYSFVVHNRIVSHGFDSELHVGNSLINMYVKHRKLPEAYIVLQKLVDRDLESWGMVIAGCLQCGEVLMVFELFRALYQENAKLNHFILYCVLKACISTGAVHEGMLIHNLIYMNSMQLKEELGNCLLEMYAKCGYSQEAFKVLECIPSRDVVSWNAVAALYAMQGRCELVDVVFQRMQYEGMKVDHVTFISLLGSCSHAGLLNEGWRYFKSMIEDHGIFPKPEHYNCIIDLLSRVGNLSDAEDILRTIPTPDFVGWISLLSSCNEHKNLELGRWCYEEAMKLDPADPSAYLLMANIQAHMENQE